MSTSISVLIVEDDLMVASMHRELIDSVPGFHVVKTVGSGTAALDFLAKHPVGLMILDIYLPGMDGVEALERIRSNGGRTGVIVVSASRDVSTINRTLLAGAFDYIIKPFTFDRIQSSLKSFQRREKSLSSGTRRISRQKELDDLIQLRRSCIDDSGLPKGFNPQLLGEIREILQKSPTPLSTVDVAEKLDVSRITTRRYLEYLVEQGEAEVAREYRKMGRPTNRYSYKE